MELLPCISCSVNTLNTTVKQLKSIIDPKVSKSDFSDANFPVDPDGRTLHLGCKVSAAALMPAITPTAAYSYKA